MIEDILEELKQPSINQNNISLTVNRNQQQPKLNIDNFEKIIDQIIKYKDQTGELYYKKFNIEYVYSYITKNIQKIEKIFKEHQKGMELIEFLYSMLSFIEHEPYETLYLSIALIDFFQIISENEKVITEIKFQDLTTYICEYNLTVEQDNQNSNDYKISKKKLPEQKQFVLNTNERQIRSIDQTPPIILKDTNNQLRRLVKENAHIDSLHHNNNLIIKSQFTKDLNKIIALDSYSDTFLIYNQDCQLEKKLIPKHQQIKGQVCTDFFWSERQQRLGATFRDQFLLFTESQDNFQFQKLFFIGDVPNIEDQNKIWYIEFINTWVTTCSRSFSDQQTLNKKDKNSKNPKHVLKSSGKKVKGGSQKLQDFLKDLDIGNEEMQNSGHKKKNESSISEEEEYSESNIDTKQYQDDEEQASQSYGNILFFWNINDEKVIFTISSPLFKLGILDITEVSYLKMIAVSSADNLVSLWDVINQKLLFKFNVQHNHMHSLYFFNSFQVILSAGYDNEIQVYNIHPFYNDFNKLGELYGHSSLVTSMQGVEGTPMVISCDDRFAIKVWDIRKMLCIQNLDLDLRSPIRAIHILKDRVCFVSSRITTIEFDSDFQFSKKESEYDETKQELIISTRQDIRYIDMQSGKTKKLIGGIVQTNEEEISQMILCQQFKKILVGNLKGSISLYSSKDAELIKQAQCHSDQITSLRHDLVNNLIITSSFDATILIQKCSSDGFFPLREIKNVSNGKEVFLMEVSVYHNLLITSSKGEERMLIWNYEFGKLMGHFNFDSEEEPTCIEFVNGYSLLLIGTTKQVIQVVEFKLSEDYIDFTLLAQLKLKEKLSQKDQEIFEKNRQQFINSRKEEIESTQTAQEDQSQIGGRSQKEQKSFDSQGRENSVINQENKSIQSKKQVSIEKAPNQQIPSNTTNISKHSQNLNVTTKTLSSNNINDPKTNSPRMKSPPRISQQQQRQQRQQSNKLDQQKILEIELAAQEFAFSKVSLIPTKLKVDLGYDQDNNQSNNPISATLIIGLQNGEVRVYDLMPVFTNHQVQFIQHSNTKSNYNPYRVALNEDYITMCKNLKLSDFKIQGDRILKEASIFDTISPQKPQSNQNQNQDKQQQQQQQQKIDTKPILKKKTKGILGDASKFYEEQISEILLLSENLKALQQCHKETITDIDLLPISGNMLLSGSQDGYLKVWTYPDLQLRCSLNIDHPLPIAWNVKIDSAHSFKQKITFTLKAMQQVLEKYRKSMTLLQEKMFNFTDFFNYQLQCGGNKGLASTVEIQQTKIETMSDIYQPRDLVFDKIKNIFEQELLGPSLRNMNETKRLADAQKEWKRKEDQYEFQFQDKGQANLANEDRAKDMKNMITFLDVNFRKKYFEKREEFYNQDKQKSSQVMDLERKLNDIKNQKRKQEEEKYRKTEIEQQSYLKSNRLNKNDSPASIQKKRQDLKESKTKQSSMQLPVIKQATSTIKSQTKVQNEPISPTFRKTNHMKSQSVDRSPPHLKEKQRKEKENKEKQEQDDLIQKMLKINDDLKEIRKVTMLNLQNKKNNEAQNLNNNGQFSLAKLKKQSITDSQNMNDSQRNYNSVNSRLLNNQQQILMSQQKYNSSDLNQSGILPQQKVSSFLQYAHNKKYANLNSISVQTLKVKDNISFITKNKSNQVENQESTQRISTETSAPLSVQDYTDNSIVIRKVANKQFHQALKEMEKRKVQSKGFVITNPKFSDSQVALKSKFRTFRAITENQNQLGIKLITEDSDFIIDQ